MDWTLAQKLKANGSELEPTHNASYVAANAQRHVPRGRKGGTGIAQGGNAAMINIRLNVLRLLDDDTITSIQRSCTRRSYSNGEESKLAHGKHRYDSIRSLSNTRLKATVRNCRFCTVSKRYPVKRGCHSMRWAEQTLGRHNV